MSETQPPQKDRPSNRRYGWALSEIGPESRSTAPTVGGLARRVPKKSSLGVHDGSPQETPAPFRNEAACEEKSC